MVEYVVSSVEDVWPVEQFEGSQSGQEFIVRCGSCG